ncbi:response regulator [Kaistella sp. 97-N-M2]|uniref:response regulator n=1 Tax=Kaistella sp. 97-N-M2 TaxID=2908645 RepID=UPI001F3593C6|nr:response regulator [Kaistella sp. 97-N-M2]UJF29532.1 response regulator [Kaistella sp. 97-N-M2]
MNVLIIEDESLNAEIIVDFLQRYDPTILISGLLQSKEQTQIWVEENGPADVVFCDIELLDGNVFSLLKKI